jgi:NADH-quinone oxidoreductase subunit N
MSDLLSVLNSLQLYSIELGLLFLAIFLILLDLSPLKRKDVWIARLTPLGFLAVLGHLLFRPQGLTGSGFGDFYSVASLDLFLKAVLLLAGLFTSLILASKRREMAKLHSACLILVVLGTLGASWVVSSGELITLFISLEILTFASYVLIAYPKRDKQAAEAGIKYLILGSLSSALFLLGSAFFYGATGSTQLAVIQKTLALQTATMPLVKMAFLLIFAGLAFKMGAFPFQFWIPDVYEGAPTWAGGFLSTCSKATGFIAFYKIFSLLNLPGSQLAPFLALVIGVLSIFTVLYGNLGACLQTNVKRLLGYSSIAHAGYLFLALINPQILGWKTVIYYFILYTFSNLLVFGVIYTAAFENGDRKELAGLRERSPVLTVCLFVGLASLAGIPPTAGFVGKFFLFISAFEAKAYLAIGAALAGILISVYYYFQILRVSLSHAQNASGAQIQKIRISWTGYLTLGVLALGTLILGIYPVPLLKILF